MAKYVFLLQNYLNENGDTLVPATYSPDPSLGGWVARQRKAYRNGKLSADKIKLLEKLGFNWDPSNN